MKLLKSIINNKSNARPINVKIKTFYLNMFAFLTLSPALLKIVISAEFFIWYKVESLNNNKISSQ